jgi:hypothetical protein
MAEARASRGLSGLSGSSDRSGSSALSGRSGLPGRARPTAATGIVLWGALALAGSLAAHAAGPAAQPPYALTVFARSASGWSQPDSIAQWRDSILVGFQNHVAKDGSDGKSSTIVQYTLGGSVQRTFSVPGHNDGLRLVGDHDLWCLQNEDANPNLVIVDLSTGKQRQLTFAPTVHGGGFDDLVVVRDRIYVTASNPNLDASGVNVFPALLRVTVTGGHGRAVTLTPVLAGNATALDIPTGKEMVLNLTDPDSLTVDPRGNVVVNSQADDELIFIRNPGTPAKRVGRLPITMDGNPTTLDDTAFVPDSDASLLFSDVQGDAVYRLDGPLFGFEPGTAYATSDTAGVVGILNLDTGALSPIATGFGSTRGAIFVTPGGQ